MHLHRFLTLGFLASALALPQGNVQPAHAGALTTASCSGNDAGCEYTAAAAAAAAANTTQPNNGKVDKRAMAPNQRYPGTAGKAFVVGKILAQEIGNSENQRMAQLPNTATLRKLLATAIADRVTRLFGGGNTQVDNVRNEWTVACYAFRDLEFSDIH